MNNTIVVNGGNALVRQAKRAITADVVATAVNKSVRKSTLINAGFTAANGALTALHASGGKTGYAIFGGIATALSGLMTGASIKEFVKAAKAKKQTSQAVKDIVNRKDFMDIVNRYLRINGKKEVTSEQLLQAYNKADKAKAVKETIKHT